MADFLSVPSASATRVATPLNRDVIFAMRADLIRPMGARNSHEHEDRGNLKTHPKRSLEPFKDSTH
jgi:hypothetical protein